MRDECARSLNSGRCHQMTSATVANKEVGRVKQHNLYFGFSRSFLPSVNA